MKKQLSVEYKGKEISGDLIKEDQSYLTLKLKSGYNINLDKKSIKIISEKIIENTKNSPTKKSSNENNNLPKIAILHTGGTIASKVDYKTGAVTSRFTPEELLNLYPELNELANLKPEMIANLSSEDMNFTHFNLLLESIKKHHDEFDGIIISHGTDIMHYSSAALQYGLKNLNIPVILVGAQRSSDRPSSDAYQNLKSAIEFIIENKKHSLNFRRVGICMHSSTNEGEFVILDGLNAKKMHSSRRDAFKQINFTPYAKITKNAVEVLRKNLQTSKNKEKLEIILYDTKLKIGFFKSHPNLNDEEIKVLSIYNIVIIEGTGLGHLAVTQFDDHTKENPKNLKAIKELIKKTKLIVGVQTVYGQTNMNIYSSGRYLLETGVLGNYMNLTTETLFLRAAHIWSKNKKDFNKVWEENLEGFETRNIDIKEDY